MSRSPSRPRLKLHHILLAVNLTVLWLPLLGLEGLRLYESALVAERYAAIRDYLRKKGTPIPTNDLWIAASAAQHGLKLLCLDRHFKEVPQVLLEYCESLP